MKSLISVFYILFFVFISGCSYPSSKIAYDKLGSGKLVSRLKINADWNCNVPEVVAKPTGVEDCVGLSDYEVFSVYKNNIYYEDMKTIHSKLMKIFGNRSSSIENFIENGKKFEFECNRQGGIAICKYHGEFGIRFVQGDFSIFKPPFGGRYIFDFQAKRNIKQVTELEISGYIYPIDGESSGIIKLY